MAAEHRDWTVAPGELLAELLEERNLTQSELARRMGRPVKTINEIVNAKAGITPQTAIQLERVLGTPARFWLNAETAFRYDLARLEEHRVAESAAPWLHEFPLDDLLRHGLIHPGEPWEQVEEILAFFEVGSPEAWESKWAEPAVAFRASTARSASRHARAVWLRWGERLAEEIDTPPFDSAKLRDALQAVGSLSLISPPAAAAEELVDLLSTAGVTVVFTPELTGTRLSGAARWLGPDRPVIQLSGRYRADDQFWFTVVHECCHLLDRPGQDFADEELDEQGPAADETEARVNALARETLVPSKRLHEFVTKHRADDPAAVKAFARALRIAPGLVVGRLQRDGHLGFEQLNGLKRRFEVE